MQITMPSFKFNKRLQHAWNAFNSPNRDPTNFTSTIGAYGGGGIRPDRYRMNVSNERSMVTSIYNRIALDVAALSIRHVKTDADGRYLETIKDSSLNYLFNTSANIDQTGKALIQDVVMSMFDEGCVAIVPTDTDRDPTMPSDAWNVVTARVGKIIEWYPENVTVRLYNEATGVHEDISLPKKTLSIIENPLYAVMNQPNSTLQRLISKLNLLDAVDNASSSGKLDIIIQLPYQVKSADKIKLADERIANMETQLAGSKYGVAYIDGTEKITQLNRPAENNLMAQITYLTSMLNSQLGITEGVMDGTADEKTMLNYYNRTVEPISSAVVDECNRKFLTKTARSQNQKLMYFRDPFKLVPVSQLAEIADKFTRNEVLSGNDVRSIIGYKPSSDPKDDKLVNKNIANKTEPVETHTEPVDSSEKKGIDSIVNVNYSTKGRQ